MSQHIPHRYVDPNFPNPNGPNDASIIIYGYTPALAVGILGVILFVISTAWHLFQLFRYRSWLFTPVVIGSLMEIVGYIARILSSKKDPYNIIYFIIQYFFIVVAPVLYSAAVYIVFTALIETAGEKYSPIRKRFILRLFIICDVVATIIQVVGASLIGKQTHARKDPKTANDILLAGLAFQVFAFSIFIALLSTFIYRARNAVMMTLSPFMCAYMVASLLIYLRTLFRLAETSQGVFGELSSHEVYFGCLEFAPIIIAVFLFNVWHPGKWLSLKLVTINN